MAQKFLPFTWSKPLFLPPPWPIIETQAADRGIRPSGPTLGHTMLTETVYNQAILDAGADFTYPGVKGGDRPTFKARLPLRMWLYNQQGGVCPVCSNLMPEPVAGDDAAKVDMAFSEINHVVSQGGAKVRKGYTTGNIFLGHRGCNLQCNDAYGSVIPMSALRLDLIATAPLPRMHHLSTGRA